jgi:hypothetical protein
MAQFKFLKQLLCHPRKFLSVAKKFIGDPGTNRRSNIID